MRCWNLHRCADNEGDLQKGGDVALLTCSLACTCHGARSKRGPSSFASHTSLALARRGARAQENRTGRTDRL